MAIIILPNKWHKQPQYPVEIDFNNPLAPTANGLVLATFGANYFNAINESQLARSNAVPLATGNLQGYGPARAPDLGGGNQALSQTSAENLVSASVHAILQMDSYGSSNFPRVFEAPNNFSLAFGNDGAIFQNTFYFTTGWSTAGLGQWKAPNGVVSSTFNGSIGVSYNGSSTANVPMFMLNGRMVMPTTVTAPAGTKTSNAGTRFIGNRTGLDRGLDARLFYLYITGRFLEESEHAELDANPWQIFRPLQRKIYSLSVGGTNVTVNLTGVEGTGDVGALTVTTTENATVTLDGVAGTGQVGTLTVNTTENVSVSLDGVEGTGEVGDLTVNTAGDVTVNLDGVAGTGQVGALTVTGDATTTLTGVEGAGEVGDLTVETDNDVTVNLAGVSGTGHVGTLTVTTTENVTVELVGVQGTGQVGIIQIPGGQVFSRGGLPKKRKDKGPEEREEERRKREELVEQIQAAYDDVVEPVKAVIREKLPERVVGEKEVQWEALEESPLPKLESMLVEVERVMREQKQIATRRRRSQEEMLLVLAYED